MGKKDTVEERQQQIEELAVKEKDKTITREEKFLLSELREAERRRKKNLLMAKERKALAQGKKDALNKILDSVGIQTENHLKDILRFVMEAKPELIPTMPEHGKDESEKPEEVRPDALLTCETCGMELIEKTAKDGRRFLGCPNWKPGEKHTTRDFATPNRESRSV